MENHAHQHDTSAKHTIYKWPFLLIFGFAMLELWGGWWTNSLALISDAWHMLTDVIALGLAWLAAIMARNPNVKRHSSGMAYPELWATIFNAVLMLVVVVWIIVEALQRMDNPPTVAGGAVIWIALAGLLVNLITAKMLYAKDDGHGHAKDLNRSAAYLHVLGDLLGSVVAIIAGVVIYFTGWLKIDPILSIVISVLLAVMTAKLIFGIIKTLSFNNNKEVKTLSFPNNLQAKTLNAEKNDYAHENHDDHDD